jgi:Na+-translocating ferredoxin:NAD+ oxidoreductase RnfD subunit
MKNFLTQIFCTKLGWVLISFLLALIFIILSDRYDWASTCAYLSMIYPVFLTLKLIVYGWFINPMRERRERKNKE